MEGTAPRHLKNILEHPAVSNANKEDAREFYRSLEDQGLSESRKRRYMQTAKQILEHHDFVLSEADEGQIRHIVRQIENSVYYDGGEYSEETKAEYKKFLHKFFSWANGGEKPEKVQFFNTHVKERDKKQRQPSDMPQPHHIKLMCQEMTNLRDKALLLTHWDLGSRIGETRKIKVGDYIVKKGKPHLKVPGNKDSDDREVAIRLAHPIIERWLQHEHPAPDDEEAYLFCHKGKTSGNPARECLSSEYLCQVLNKAAERAEISRDTTSHNIRAARITYLYTKLGMNERTVEQRVGHVVGSDQIKRYVSILDQQSNEAYLEAYGDAYESSHKDEDLKPLSCPECESTVAGFWDRCPDCNAHLETAEIKEMQTKADQARDLLHELIEEEYGEEELEQVLSST